TYETYIYTNENGTTTSFNGTDDQTVDEFSLTGGTLSLSLEDDGAAPLTVDLISIDANNDILAGTDGGLYLDVSSVAISETVTTLADNGDGTFTYTSEDGTITTFDSRLATVADNGDGTFDITDDSGTTITIDTNNTVTTLVDNADGSFTYTSEDGTVTTFTETTSTLVDN